MTEDTELELLITIVVTAENASEAQASCHDLLRRVGGRLVEITDCSDEEPGCWSVTIGRGGERGTLGAAALSRAIRQFLRELGPEHARHRVSCEPPTAWAVIDDPELLDCLVRGGERLLVEAWLTGTLFPVGELFTTDPDESAPLPSSWLTPAVRGRDGVRVDLVVEVATDRRARAEWHARALAGRLSHEIVVTEIIEAAPLIGIQLELGVAPGQVGEVAGEAMSRLGGTGWSRLREQDGLATLRWTAAPTPPSGIAAIEVRATGPAHTDG